MAGKRDKRVKKAMHRLASGEAGNGWAAKRAAKISNRRNQGRRRSPNRSKGFCRKK
ncbi:MAG TPA: hypothetical protein PK367_01495 [Candidatus Paceibacterota bacterium]|nr:hypothetical protein [Candidatus Paceibacterota bacterium]